MHEGKPLQIRRRALAAVARPRVPAVRRRVLRPVVRFREMRFHTLDAAVPESIATSHDYFRHTTLGLAVQRLSTEETPSSLAEVGVWWGEKSAFLHRLAPDRHLYLLDTFDSFPAEDRPRGAVDARLRNTSAAAVRRRVGPSDAVTLVPGRGPETLERVAEERFALVLLDLDLLAPTRATLEFFYPRLSPGGYLIIHDYNNPESEWACQRAFDEFLVERPERLTEWGDVWGSASIRRTG